VPDAFCERRRRWAPCVGKRCEPGRDPPRFSPRRKPFAFSLLRPDLRLEAVTSSPRCASRRSFILAAHAGAGSQRCLRQLCRTPQTLPAAAPQPRSVPPGAVGTVLPPAAIRRRGDASSQVLLGNLSTRPAPTPAAPGEPALPCRRDVPQASALSPTCLMSAFFSSFFF